MSFLSSLFSQNTIPETLELAIYDSQRQQFTGKVYSIETNNEIGPLSLLPGHTNFISIVKTKLSVNSESGRIKEFQFETGILRVFNSHVDVYLGIELDIESQTK